MMYSDQKGMVPNTGLENYSASLNFGHKITDKLQLDTKLLIQEDNLITFLNKVTVRKRNATICLGWSSSRL